MKKIDLIKVLTAIIFLVISCPKMLAVNLFSNNYRSITIPYISVDAENNPVILSAVVTYPTKSSTDSTPNEIKFIVLNNHGTITKDDQAPSGSTPLDAISTYAPNGAMCLMATEDALVIQCDYLGYGYTRDRIHPYCNPDLTARNVLDGFQAALDTIQARNIAISPDYYTLNVGYSQGGEVTMAVQRYLETKAPEELVNEVKLKKSIAGAGPYNLEYIFEDLCKQDNLTYACSLPLTLEALFTAYKEGCLKSINPDDLYITPEFRKSMNEQLLSKEYKTEELNAWLKTYFGKDQLTVRDMFNYDKLNNDGPAARAIRKALHKCNMLDGTWIPKTPMVLFHYTKDEVVQYGNSEQAVQLFGNQVTLYTEQDNLSSQLSATYRMLLNMIKSNPQSHSDYGIIFYGYILGGVLR